MKMVPNCFLVNLEFLCNKIIAHMPFGIDDFHDCIEVFDNLQMTLFTRPLLQITSYKRLHAEYPLQTIPSK